MASASKPSAATAAVALLVLLASAILLAPANASTLTVFTGPGCSGNSKDINHDVCTCSDITGYQGGFEFVFTEGEEAYLYRGHNCSDPHPLHLHKETRYCHHVDYTSVKMIC